MLIDKDNISKVIPQRKPFIMIENLLFCSEKEAGTSLNIECDNCLAENGHFSSAGILENMAQTAAAYLGYDAYLHNLPAPIGFIAAVKNFEIKQLPKVNSQITTHIKYEEEILNIHVVQASVNQNNEEIAHAELRIFIKDSKL